MVFKSRIIQLFVESTLREEEPLDFGIDPKTAPSTVVDTVPEPAPVKPAAKPVQKTIDYYGQKIPLESPRNEKEVVATLDRLMNAIRSAVKKDFAELYSNPKELLSDMREFIKNPLLRSKYKSKIEPVFRPETFYGDGKELPEKYEIYLQDQITKIYYKVIPRYAKAIDKLIDKERIDAIEKGIDPQRDSIPQRHIDLKDRNYIKALLSGIWSGTMKKANSSPSHADNYSTFRDTYKTMRSKKFAKREKDKGRKRSGPKDQAPQA